MQSYSCNHHKLCGDCFGYDAIEAKDARIAELEAQVARLTMRPETVADLRDLLREHPTYCAWDTVEDFDRYAAAIGGSNG